MWALNNQTPFAAERCWVRDKDGAEVWLVAVKGTFDIHPDGTTSVAEKQADVCMAPEYRGDPPVTSLLYDTDLNHKKVRTDVLLNGHAYAPKDQPATFVDVRLRLGAIDKTIRVFGDRVWKRSALGFSMSAPEPFRKMPITYERAFGGIDHQDRSSEFGSWEYRNPVGVGFASLSSHLEGKPAPNVENPKQLVFGWEDRPTPMGFGPIAGHWAQRVKYVGTYDKKWERERQPLLPLDFDDQFYQCAPQDQQVDGFLRGGEWVEVENATSGGLLRFQIPRITLGFTTRFDGLGSEVHRAKLHTVMIEPDCPRVLVTWHTHLQCHHKVLKLMTTTISVKRRINASQASGAIA